MLSEIQINANLKQGDWTTYLDISNARATQESQEVRKRQPTEELSVYLSDEFGLVDTRYVHVRIVYNSYIPPAAAF